MFAIFSLRRPDILPVGNRLSFQSFDISLSFAASGDLGIQRGLVRWFLSLHSSSYLFCISPDKIDAGTRGEDQDEDDVLPSLNKGSTSKSTKSASGMDRGVSADISSVPPVGDASVDVPAMPEPFTPSINRTLKGPGLGSVKPPPLPEGLSAAALKARLEGKKRIKYVLPKRQTPAYSEFVSQRGVFDTTRDGRPHRELETLSECR
jgi:DNA-3-methyladenine glycosylase II